MPLFSAKDLSFDLLREISREQRINPSQILKSSPTVERMIDSLLKKVTYPRVLITGCPRSGTTSVAMHYEKLGLEVGLEQSGAHVTVDFKQIHQRHEYPIIIVLIRHPIPTIESLVELFSSNDIPGKGLYDQMMHIWPQYNQYQGIERAARYWFNTYAQLTRYPFIRIEDMEIEQLNQHLQARKLTEEKLMATLPDFYGNIVHIANHYGYQLLPF